MHTVIYVSAGIVAWLCAMVLWQYYGVVQLPGRLCRNFPTETKKTEEERAAASLSGKALLCMAVLVLCILVFFSVYIGHIPVKRNEKCKLELILFLLTVVGWIDARKRIIPNRLIFGTFVIRLALGIWEYFFLSDAAFRRMLIQDALGFVVSFGILFLIAFFSRHALGYGDVKLFAVLGITLGLAGAYNTLFYAAICTLLAALYLMIVKKKKRNYEIPFGPFIWLGYICVLVFQVF